MTTAHIIGLVLAVLAFALFIVWAMMPRGWHVVDSGCVQKAIRKNDSITIYEVARSKEDPSLWILSKRDSHGEIVLEKGSFHKLVELVDSYG